MTHINFDDVTKTIRQLLIESSGLSSNMVRNAASMFGTETLKNVENDIFSTITPEDTILFFLLSQTTNNNNCVSFDEDDKTIQLSVYNAHITVYGNNSIFYADTCASTLRTASIRQEAYDKGIFIEKVSTADMHYEIKQNVSWMRADFDIIFCCEEQYETKLPVYVVEQLSQLSIEGVEE